MSRPLAGVLAGGAGRRMGGLAKGLLRGPDGRALVERLRSAVQEAGMDVVLVGAGEAYDGLDLPRLDDEPRGVGPLGGLAALLRAAGDRPAIALACDMPFVSAALLTRLASAPAAAVIAPRRGGVWEPLCARYDAALVLPLARARLASGALGLQGLLDAAGAVALPLSPAGEAELRDWDAPGDVTAS